MVSKHERSVVVTPGGLQALAQNPLSKVEGMILWHLVTMLPISGNIVSQAQLAADLSITTIQINRAVKRFCILGFLMRGVKVGLSHHYKLNPAFFRILS